MCKIPKFHIFVCVYNNVFFNQELCRGSWDFTTARLQTRGRLSPFSVAAARKRTASFCCGRVKERCIFLFWVKKERKSLTEGEIATAMVYVDSWDTFVERSISLFRADPVAVSCFNLFDILRLFFLFVCVFFFVTKSLFLFLFRG